MVLTWLETKDLRGVLRSMTKSKVTVYRHIFKTITWRVVGTIDTMLLGWYVSGDFKTGLTIGGLEVFTKMFLYFLHERVWYKIDLGVKREES